MKLSRDRSDGRTRRKLNELNRRPTWGARGKAGGRADLEVETLGAKGGRELQMKDLEGEGLVVLEVAGELVRGGYELRS